MINWLLKLWRKQTPKRKSYFKMPLKKHWFLEAFISSVVLHWRDEQSVWCFRASGRLGVIAFALNSSNRSYVIVVLFVFICARVCVCVRFFSQLIWICLLRSTKGLNIVQEQMHWNIRTDLVSLTSCAFTFVICVLARLIRSTFYHSIWNAMCGSGQNYDQQNYKK